jgi:hypothetical protein
VNFQHCPVQFTRLPTTDVQRRSTGALGVSPVADTFTFERIVPLSESIPTRAVESFATSASITVVLALIVGRTDTACSRYVTGEPASFVTVNIRR